MSDPHATPDAGVRRFRADPSLKGMRLSRAISGRIEGLSVRAAKSLVDLGRVFVNGQRARLASERIRGNEEIEVHLDRFERPEALGPVDILWEGQGLLAIRKPAGLVVYGTRGVTGGTVLPVLERLLKALGKWKPGDRLILVHRLDRDTSGLLLVARQEEAARNLERQFRQGRVEKRYLVLAEGDPKPSRFRRVSQIRAARPPGEPEGGGGSSRPEARDRRGRGSETEFFVLERFPGCALLEARPLTGRTHQIRIHLAEFGHPVLGDVLYGRRKTEDPFLRSIQRQMLHAASLRFEDPDTGEKRQVEAPLAPDMRQVLEQLRASRSAGTCAPRSVRKTGSRSSPLSDPASERDDLLDGERD